MNVNHRSSSLVTHLFLRLHQPEAKYRTPFALATPFADLKVSNIRRPLLSGVLLLSLLLPSIAQAGRGRALFSLDTMAGTPFPSDLFAVADPTQNTGLRVTCPSLTVWLAHRTARTWMSSTRWMASIFNRDSQSPSMAR
jgi:hypothetical protein